MKKPYEQILDRPNDYVQIIKYLLMIIALLIGTLGFTVYKIIDRDAPTITFGQTATGDGNVLDGDVK